MGKFFKILLAGTGLLIIIGFIVMTLSIDSIVKSGIENVGSEMTGTTVTVERVSISPLSGSGTVHGFRVENPDGYSEDYAFQVEDFSMELNIWSLFSDEIIVHEIMVTSPSVYLEQKVPENNLRTILNRINDTSPQETSDTKLLIEHFILTDGRADLYTEVGGERSASVELSTIEINDLGSNGSREAVERVVQEISDRIISQVLDAAAESGAEELQDAIKDIFN